MTSNPFGTNLVSSKLQYVFRELTSEHIPLLENIQRMCHRVIKEKYGLKASQLKMYFHYLPSYYHLHVHIINIKYEAPGAGQTNVLLENAIANLKLFPDYFQRATLALSLCFFQTYP